MSEALHRRLRRIHARAAVLRYEHRRRNTSAGVWYRLRRTLVDARAAYSISAEDADRLARGGAREAPVGVELVPARRILWAAPEQLEGLASACPVPLRLGAELLGATALVLVPLGAEGDSPLASE